MLKCESAASGEGMQDCFLPPSASIWDSGEKAILPAKKGKILLQNISLSTNRLLSF